MIQSFTYSDILSRANIDSLESIANKYKALYAKYQCFNEIYTSSIHTLPYNAVQAPSTQYVRSYKRHHTHRHLHVSCKKNKDPQRLIVGYLNTINTDNYSRIYSKLVQVINYNNIDHVVKAIVHKCYTATIFVNVYIKLLYDIDASYHIKTLLRTELDCALDKLRINDETLQDLDTYDVFCYKQKHKSMILGMTITISKMYKAMLIDWTFVEQYYAFFEELIKHENDEYYLDIGLNVVIELLKTFKVLQKDPKKLAMDVHTDIPRLKFLLQNLSDFNY